MNQDVEFSRIIDCLRVARLAAGGLKLSLLFYLIDMALAEALLEEKKQKTFPAG